MSDVATTARTARETLARGLAALQSDPNVPPRIMDLAGAVAQAMGALMQIERSQGVLLAAQAPVALGHVQTALAGLQEQSPQIPAVMQAMEAVAGSLGMVHTLSRLAQQAAAPAAPPPAPPVAQAPAPVRLDQFAATEYSAPAEQVVQARAHAQAAQQQYAPPPAAAAPYAPPPQPAFQPPPAAAPRAPQGPQPRPDAPVVAADLGAHSPTNFYKGLSGNDIIDHGGIFVATYKIPKIGTPVRLHVSLPGGYEFDANSVVRWTRESNDSSVDAPPGFGAQFTDITAEARQLVYRYVRNREPLFHDDL